MRAVALVCLIGLTAAGSLTGCQLAQGPSDTSDIVIAVDLELSGANVDIGAAYNRALQLKVDQLNVRGILGGRKIKLRVKDNRSDGTLSQTNIADFANSGDVTAMITGVCSTCVLNSTQLINDRRIPTISLAPAEDVVEPVADRRYLFKVAPNAKDGAAALISELRRASVKKVGILTTSDDYGADGREALGHELSKTDIRKIVEDQVKPTDTEMDQQIRKLVAEEPDALVLWTYPTLANIAVVAAQKAGYKGRLFLDGAAAGELFLSPEAGNAANNAILITTQTMAIDDVIATSPAKAARKQWFRDYTSRHGRYFGYASFAADAVQMLVNAIIKVGGTDDRERLRDVLESLQMDGLSGPIRMTPNNHSGIMPQGLSVLVARNGRWRLSS